MIGFWDITILSLLVIAAALSMGLVVLVIFGDSDDETINKEIE